MLEELVLEMLDIGRIGERSPGAGSLRDRSSERAESTCPGSAFEMLKCFGYNLVFSFQQVLDSTDKKNKKKQQERNKTTTLGASIMREKKSFLFPWLQKYMNKLYQKSPWYVLSGHL